MAKPTVEELQRQIDALKAERGIPVDAIAAAHQNLRDHVAARKAASPGVDFSGLDKALDVERPSTRDAERIKLEVENHLANNAHLAGEHDYLSQLARDLHAATLDEPAEEAEKADEEPDEDD